jgi:hypothetical protein
MHEHLENLRRDPEGVCEGVVDPQVCLSAKKTECSTRRTYRLDADDCKDWFVAEMHGLRLISDVQATHEKKIRNHVRVFEDTRLG